MARGIPDIPLDGETYASAGVAGLPMVLEYDGPTGGYKLVVSTEAGVAINISGTVEVTGGQLTVVGSAQYGEDTPHTSGQTGTFVMGVRRDADSSAVDADGDYAGLQVDALGRLKTFIYGGQLSITGSIGSIANLDEVSIRELGFGIALDSDSELNTGYSGTFLGAQIMGHSGGANLRRASFAVDADNEDRSTRFSLITASDLRGYNSLTTNWDRATIDSQGRLHVNALVTGTVTAVLQTDLEIGAVEIKDSDTDTRTMVGGLSDAIANPTGVFVGAFNMIYDIAGSNWDRDPARLVLDDGMAAGVFAQRISFGMHKDYVSAAWDANFGGNATVDAVSGAEGLKNALNIRGMLYGLNAAGTFDRLLGPNERGLYVSMISGSFPGQNAAIEIDDTISATLRAGIVGGANLMYDVAGDNWERDPARIPGDAMVQAVFPQRVSFGVHFNYDAGAWERHYGGDVSADGIVGNLGGSGLDNSLNTRSVILLNNGNFVYDTAQGSSERGMHTTMISGSFPGQDGATLLGDSIANPYAGLVGGLNMGFDPVSGTWERVRIDPATGGILTSLTGTIDTELPAALVLADAMTNPTAPAVAGHLMGYNGVTWDRLYMGVSGSLAVDLVSQLDAINDEVTAYVTGTLRTDFVTGSIVGIGGITKVIRREVVNISGSGGEFELIAANGSNRLKVTSIMLIADADTNVHIQSGWTGTAVTGPMSLPADGDGFFLNTPSTPDQFHFESQPGENLVLDQSAAAAIGGWLQYFVEA